MWAKSYWQGRFWQSRYWPKHGQAQVGVVPGTPYWGPYWQKGYWQAHYWPGTGPLPPPFNPPIPVPGPPPPPVPFVFQPPLTYDWVRFIQPKSFMSKVSYNAAFRTMAILYKDGTQEVYLNVGPDVAESLTSAFSPDSFAGLYIYGKYGRQ